MKKQILMALSLVVLALTLHSCFGGGNEEPTFSQKDLYSNGGLWLEDGKEHYVRFTTEQTDKTGYLWGCEWDEEDEMYEEYLERHGNGWFKYQLLQKNLTEIHMMDMGTADIPKVYVIKVLTADRLEYYEKDHSEKKFTFTKVVETK